MVGMSQIIYEAVLWLVQFIVGVVGVAYVLSAFTYRKPRWRVSFANWRKRGPPHWWLRAAGCRAESAALQSRRLLLAGCGIRIEPAVYLAARRSLIFVCALMAGGTAVCGTMGMVSGTALWKALPIIAMLAVVVTFDKSMLDSFKRYRSDRIRRELIAVMNQLIYYMGSRLHLHGKLMRCMPYTRIIRGDFQLMLNEWYYDADKALLRFKERLGTSEGYSFAETMRSMRLHESDEVYRMLRDVLAEYKAGIELAKAGRKETASYVLFVLAGLPILYTFQIFLYPWVQESQKLFEVLKP
ncbi:hypothetical protein KB449_21540 [Cohnella sp. F6_2S_P_1]|uniref:Type II secretion system protein GspF domain-containing protein n=2 Tax=Cohnella hashimotonis TaxID=2826895 RepID=A0ABT6TLF6_9BACL|nr:hypothetical protein [Cohnella hashimotonis]MDI4647549.1 hypothetical protein [Cohnella hashimotonis]